MPGCVVRGCKNYDKKVKKEHGISYHRFPNDLTRHEIWSCFIREQRKDPYYKPHSNARVCSAHFHDTDFDISKTGLRRLKASAIPRFEIEVCEIEERRPSTPAQSSQVEERPSTPAQSSEVEEMIIDVDISDLDSIFDSPRKVQLKKRIDRLEERQSIAVKKIKNLQKQNARLKEKNKSLLNIIKDLKRSTCGN